MAIRTSDPVTHDQLAYARLVVREALRHGGSGWLDYDRAFGQQAATDPSLRWNTLLPGLQAATTLSRGTAVFCTLCREVDHTRAQCALLCLTPQPVLPPQQHPTRCICTSWNRGTCIFFGNCTYRHVCITCQQMHKARDCPRIPETSIYKQPRALPQPPQSAKPATPTARLQQYVALQTETSKGLARKKFTLTLSTMLCGGDLLTAKRARGSQYTRSNSLRGKDRLEGL